jgi:CobQ-like glutamine amidotransferase family enzyme
MGHRYISNSGEEMRGAGILDLETRGGPQRFMQHAACEVTIDGITDTVVGFENHSGLTVLGTGCEPFGKVIAGAGNNGRDGLEGARTKSVFGEVQTPNVSLPHVVAALGPLHGGSAEVP